MLIYTVHMLLYKQMHKDAIGLLEFTSVYPIAQCVGVAIVRSRF